MDPQSSDHEVARLKAEAAALRCAKPPAEELRDHGALFLGSLHAHGGASKNPRPGGRIDRRRKGGAFSPRRSGGGDRQHSDPEETSVRKRSSLIGKVLEKGLAGWAYRHRKVALVTDTASDNRWLTLANQPYSVGSALAVPIFRGQVVFGLLTLLHPNAGHFTQESATIMKATAHQLALVLENVRLYAKLDESRRSIAAYSRALDKELEKGRNIQQGFLPEQLPSISGWEIDARFSPAYQMAGDFYDVFFLEDACLGLVIADVCDKGVGSALFMGLFRSLIRIFCEQPMPDETPGDPAPLNASPVPHPALSAVARTNDYVAQHHGWMGMFATLFFGVLNPQTGRLAYVNGGHEPLLVIGPAGVRAQLGTTGPAVGSCPGLISRFERSSSHRGMSWSATPTA